MQHIPVKASLFFIDRVGVGDNNTRGAHSSHRFNLTRFNMGSVTSVGKEGWLNFPHYYTYLFIPLLNSNNLSPCGMLNTLITVPYRYEKEQRDITPTQEKDVYTHTHIHSTHRCRCCGQLAAIGVECHCRECSVMCCNGSHSFLEGQRKNGYTCVSQL